MNNNELNPVDESLRRLLVSAIETHNLPDGEIELWLNSTTPEMGIGEEQIQRLVGKLNRLLESGQVTTPRNSEVLESDDSVSSSEQGPRLISVSEPDRLHRPNRLGVIASSLASVLALISATILIQNSESVRSTSITHADTNEISVAEHLRAQLGDSPVAVNWMAAKSLPEVPAVVRVSVGDEIVTAELERRRLMLPDDSVLYVNCNSRVRIATERKIELTRGELFVEVSPQPVEGGRHLASAEDPETGAQTALPFEILTPHRTVTALGTKFAVSVSDAETDVTVTQGRVKISGIEDQITAGQRFRAVLSSTTERSRPGDAYTLTSAMRASAELEWTRELISAATGPLVASSSWSGGALVAIDPNGQSSRLSLRKYHVDIHIEDGFARTTIDQTYFNHTHNRLEGTFHFPLPTDASLSRLAMYVNGRLMEGGMAERQHARNTFEQIVHKMQDPALLEWVDGSTFKMRVFPLEPRQEKRIILSYSQRLDSMDGQLHYRFPGGNTMGTVRDWSAHLRIKDGAGCKWHSQTHAMTATEEGGDLLLDAASKHSVFDRDLVVRVSEQETSHSSARFSSVIHDGHQYLMLRLRPELQGEMQRKPHHWVFLFEHAGDRNPLLARTQIEIIRTLLNNAEHTDTFSIVTAATQAGSYSEKPEVCSRENISAAVAHLERVHLIGALDLAAAIKLCRNVISLNHSPLDAVERVPLIVHVGSGMPALGERDSAKLAAMVPVESQYVGIGVGRRWNQSMMKLAASKTGGLTTQINPDEEIAWRAFNVFSNLHSSRLINVSVNASPSSEPMTSATVPSLPISREKGQSPPSFLVFSDIIFHGEEIAAICRIPEGHSLPASVTVTAKRNGQRWSQIIPVKQTQTQADCLPRQWAKLEIDRLLAEDAQLHRESIVALSKSMYVMSPFTSLLVLEDEAMYTQYNIDRGRKDHWALYPCPEQIEVVVESSPEPVDSKLKSWAPHRSAADVFSTISRLPSSEDLASVTGLSWTEIPLGKMDPSSAVEMLQRLFNPAGTELPSIRFAADGKRLAVSGSAAQVMQVKQVLSDLGEDGSGMRWSGSSLSEGIGFVNRFGRNFENDVTRDLLFRKAQPARAGEFSSYLGFTDSASQFWFKDPETPDFHEAEFLVDSKFTGIRSGNDIHDDTRSSTTFKSLPELWERQSLEIRDGVDLLESPINERRSFNQHRWSTESVSPDPALVSLPTFTGTPDRSIEDNPFPFGDLLSHASGLNTSLSDVLATIEAEAGASRTDANPLPSPPHKPETNHHRGRVDEDARNLIDNARSHGWESITLRGRSGEPGITVLYDGHGRHVWERTVSEGLREQVVCDGSTLWHIYREIGLASKRPFSRHHHRAFSAIVPWLLPSCDELSRNSDVIALDQRTVSIVPRSIASDKSYHSHTSPNSHGSNENDESHGIRSAVCLHLIFSSDGRLTERRAVEPASGHVLRRITWDAAGTVRVLDGDGKELAAVELHHSVVAAPLLVPDLNGLVTLPMPVRTPEELIERFQRNEGSAGADVDLSEDEALSLMLAYTASGNGARVVEIARRRFIETGDTRDGLYVLLSRFPNALVQTGMSGTDSPPSGKAGFDLRPSVEGSTLKQFLRQYINWLRDTNAWRPDNTGISEFRIQAPKGSFLDRLATARNLYVRWRTDEATRDRTSPQILEEVQRSLEFIATCRTSEIGWTLLRAMRTRLDTPELLAKFVIAAERFEQHPQIRSLVQRERVIALYSAGQHAEGFALFREWLNLQLDEGVVPPIGQELYDSAVSNDGLQAMNALLLESSRRLIDSQKLMVMHSLIVRIRELGNAAIANEMMTMLLDQVLELPAAAELPRLWRFASTLAEESGRKRLAVDRLEKAIQLDFSTRPTVINRETVRSDYSALLAGFEELITASNTLEVAPSDDLVARIIQAADQWRALDDDDALACQTASRLLTMLQQTQLAWEYLTTPLAENSGESAPWIALARSLSEDNRVDLANMAWTRAFEFESTNPEILLEHARMLQTAGRVLDARNLLEKVVSSEWQPRFSKAKTEAQMLHPEKFPVKVSPGDSVWPPVSRE